MAALESIAGAQYHAKPPSRFGTDIDFRVAVILTDNAIELCENWFAASERGQRYLNQARAKVDAEANARSKQKQLGPPSKRLINETVLAFAVGPHVTRDALIQIRRYRNDLYHEPGVNRPAATFVLHGIRIAQAVFDFVFEHSYAEAVRQLEAPYRPSTPNEIPSLEKTDELPSVQIEFLARTTAMLGEMTWLCDEVDANWIRSSSAVLEQWHLLSEANENALNPCDNKLEEVLALRADALTAGVASVDARRARVTIDLCGDVHDAMRNLKHCDVTKRLKKKLGDAFDPDWQRTLFWVARDTSDAGRLTIDFFGGETVIVALEGLTDESGSELILPNLPLYENTP